MNKEYKILAIAIIALLITSVSLQVYAMSNLKPDTNTLENGNIYGSTQNVEIEIQFGEDIVQELPGRTILHPQVAGITIGYGDGTVDIDMENVEVKVVGDGRVFRVSSTSDGFMLFGYQTDDDPSVYDITVHLNTADMGLLNFDVVGMLTHDQDQ